MTFGMPIGNRRMPAWRARCRPSRRRRSARRGRAAGDEMLESDRHLAHCGAAIAGEHGALAFGWWRRPRAGGSSPTRADPTSRGRPLPCAGPASPGSCASRRARDPWVEGAGDVRRAARGLRDRKFDHLGLRSFLGGGEGSLDGGVEPQRVVPPIVRSPSFSGTSSSLARLTVRILTCSAGGSASTIGLSSSAIFTPRRRC